MSNRVANRLNQHCACQVTDRHIPTAVMDNVVRRLVTPPRRKLVRFVRSGTTCADIGCGPGYFTIPMAEMAGTSGKVYALDSDPKSIRALELKATARGLEKTVEAHTTSAARMDCIPDGSVDFVFANGVLCCMTNHNAAVEEIKRIMKPAGLAYISVTRAFRKNDPRSVRKEEWGLLLAGFKTIERKDTLLHRWAVVSLPKQSG